MKRQKGTLGCINGIRVFSMSWVILGHCILIPYASRVVQNMLYSAKEFSSRWTFQAVMNGYVSCDTFFVLSGLLVSYLTLKELRRLEGKLNWFMFYLYRWLRLTPVYMAVLAVWVITSPFWADGPFFPQQGLEDNSCEDSWWKNMLYINIFFYKDRICMAWSWYLATDCVFYILSPFIIYPLFRRPFYGYLSSAGFFIATTIAPFIVTMVNSFSPIKGVNVEGHVRGHQNYTLYYAPHCRMGPYIQGLILGYLMFKNSRRANIPLLVNLLGWVVSAAVAVSVLYGLYPYAHGVKDMPLVLSAFYISLHRSAWGLSVCWVIYSCVKTGGPVNAFLSLPIFIPLGRLTYCAYLVHVPLICLFVIVQQTPMYADDISLIFMYFGCLVATFLVAFPVSLLCESPCMGILKLYFRFD